MGKYGAFKRNFDFSGLSSLEAQKMLGYVELMNQCMARDYREIYGYYISDMAAFKETDPMLYEVFSRQELSSLVLCPFYFEIDLVGFVGVDEPKGMSLALPVMQIASSHMSGLLQKSFYVEKRTRLKRRR